MRLHPTGKFNNHAASYKFIEAKPLAAAMGAEICGVHIRTLTDAQAEEIRHALFRHKMIYFRGQKLTHDDQEAFSLRLAPSRRMHTPEACPTIEMCIRLSKKRMTLPRWYSARAGIPTRRSCPEPPAITILRSVQVPPFGGDTPHGRTRPSPIPC